MFEAPSVAAPVTWYVERRISPTYADATRALGMALRVSSVEPAVGLRVRAVRHSRPGEASGFSSRLRLGRLGRTIPIEIEVEPWSRQESVLGVRPARPPAVHLRSRYVAAATAALAAVDRCITQLLVVPDLQQVRRAS
jgi:hypothetical protein